VLTFGKMFRRDVMVLGFSDGVMCAATGFGLILQKLIFRGVISWNKQGWIIQSVSTHILYDRGYLSKVVLIDCPKHADMYTGMGSFIPCCSSGVDFDTGMALDSYRFLCAPRSGDDDEAAQLCFL
jgi:hypothetical protein